MGQSRWYPDRKVEIYYAWKRTDFAYPDERVPQEFEALCCVYRWAIFLAESSNPSAQYIGETQNLAARVRGYVNPGKSQMTNQRVKRILDEARSKGLPVELHTLDFDPFQIVVGDRNPVLCNTTELHDQFKRKLMENFAILTTPPDCELLNVVVDRISKKIYKARKTQQMHDSHEGRIQLYEDRDVKTLREIQKRREETDANAQTN